MTHTNHARPDSVPAHAELDEAAALWRAHEPERDRIWTHPAGRVLFDAQRADGALHGEVRWNLSIDTRDQFASRVALHASLGLPDGPTSCFVARYERGAPVHVCFRAGFDFKDDLTLSLRDGRPHGELDWIVSSLDGPLFRWGESTIDARALGLPKPRPHRLRATFVDGEMTSVRFFAYDGSELRADVPIAEWGEHTSRDALAGYVTRGAFAEDLARFFPNAKRKAQSESLRARFDALPARAREAAAALDALLCSEIVPSMPFACDFGGYGFDCAANELYGAEDEKYVGLTSNGSGDMYLLDLTTGEVVFYAHDEGEVSPAFSSIDECCFALVRVEAAARGLLPKDALAALFARLELDFPR